jgi:hypothetical protein
MDQYARVCGVSGAINQVTKLFVSRVRTSLGSPSAAADVIFNTFVDLVTESAQLAVISAIKIATTEESHAPGCPQLERDGTGHKSND